MSFPLLLIAKCDSGAGEFEGKNIEKQLRISIRRRDKKITYAFPSTMVVRVGNTIAFPFHCCFCMRIHMRVPMFLWKHIPSVMFFNNHMYSCGNTFSRHTRLQSFFCLIFLFLCRNTYVFTCCSGYIPNETYARFHANLF